MNEYLKVLKQYADFKSRARRKEFWMYLLFNSIFALIAMLLDNILGFGMEMGGIRIYGPLYCIFVAATIIPSFAVTVRRLHDVGQSGWMYFIALIPIVGAIVILVFLCSDSQDGHNKWGPNPKKNLNDNNSIEDKSKDLYNP